MSAEVARRAGSGALFDFFHGATPWVAYDPTIPYACYLEAPPNALSFAERMLWLIRNPSAYKRIRVAARAHSIEHFTWTKVGDRIAAELLPIVA